MDEWNDSLTTDYLWSNVNFGEAVSEVMTPLTWSLLRTWRRYWVTTRDLLPFGNIGGRLYSNVSYFATSLAAGGKHKSQFAEALDGVLFLPRVEGLEIPIATLSLPERLIFIWKYIVAQIRWAQAAEELPGFIARNPAWCKGMREHITAASSPRELAGLWASELRVQAGQAYLGVLASAMRFSSVFTPMRQELIKLVGLPQAEILASNLSSDVELLASLDPLLGLDRLTHGEIDCDLYIEQYGHRGPNEWELFTPRPVETPGWLEARISEHHAEHTRVQALLENQRNNFNTAWDALTHLYPTKSGHLRRKFREIARRGRLREAIRSELVRVIWVLRQWALRAGALTGLNEDVFFLTIDETVSVLNGGEIPLPVIQERRQVYEKHRALPPYPPLILGHFDPFAWAADEKRGAQVYAAGKNFVETAPEEGLLRGAAGSTGCVEGRVRVIGSLAQAGDLQQGEVLVTTLTDIGWTPFFPRAAAIITDVGAALSHAAIVARELGIPAVVGCGVATRRLKTGDRVRVDGGQGLVEILEIFVTPPDG